MHDIKFIKENSKFFDESLEKRGLNPCSKQLINKHEQYLMYLNKKQELQENRNNLTKEFKNSSNVEGLKKQVQTLKKEIEKTTDVTDKLFVELKKLLLNIPNLVNIKTPTGVSESDNRVIEEIGGKPIFNFAPRDHLSIGEKLKILSYDEAIKISGGRCSVLKSELAQLNRALINFFIDHNVNDFDYQEYVVPELVKSSSLEGTGQLPKFKEDLFETNFNDLWLIPTAEVPLTNLNRDSIIQKDLLPLRFTTFTNCFRSEAGASGKDTKGLMREHQFGKVEIVSVTDPDKSSNEFDRMISCVESILNKLGISYRKVELCAGDLGFSSSYTIDFEIWMPGQNKYREVSSCSNCTDFQSRRMKMRFKDKKIEDIKYPHTLNGSALAIGRTIIAILENYQNQDGSITVPPVLQDYMNGLKKISHEK